MTAPLPTLRHGVRGTSAEAPPKDAGVETIYRDTDKLGIRILHLAERETNYAKALCGRKRDKPLEPGAEGELCVVCADVFWRKHGYEYGKRSA